MAKVAIKMTWAKETPGTHQYQEERDKEGRRVIRTTYIEKWVVKQYFGGKVPKAITITIEDK